jgi:hypothetical protein
MFGFAVWLMLGTSAGAETIEARYVVFGEQGAVARVLGDADLAGPSATVKCPCVPSLTQMQDSSFAKADPRGNTVGMSASPGTIAQFFCDHLAQYRRLQSRVAE